MDELPSWAIRTLNRTRYDVFEEADMQEINFEYWFVMLTNRIIVGSYCEDKVGKLSIRSLCLLVPCLLAVEQRLDMVNQSAELELTIQQVGRTVEFKGRGDNFPPFTSVRSCSNKMPPISNHFFMTVGAKEGLGEVIVLKRLRWWTG